LIYFQGRKYQSERNHMIINDIEQNKQYLPRIQQQQPNTPETTKSEKFTDSLNALIKDVDSMQKDSANLTDSLIKGEPVDIHDVMIASEKAKTSFQLLMEMRNKFVDMYHEVTRMQI
jgi:flagellar hook-basal body complex protein FliE